MNLGELGYATCLDSSSNLPLDAPFTSAVARAQGVSKADLARLVQHDLLRQPIRGVYVAAQVPDSTMLRVHCLSLVVPDDCVIVDRHAGWLHGAEMTLAPNEHLSLQPIRVFRPSGCGRLRNGLADSGERDLKPGDITEVRGIPVTTALRTAWDLGRVRWPATALSGLDAMLRRRLFTHDELLAGVERFRRQRWVTTLRAMAPLADGRSASPGESALRLCWLVAGLPAPTPQYEVWIDGELIAILDLADPDLGYAAEYDGVEWHSSPPQREHDRTRRAAVRDRSHFVIDAFTKANVYGQRRNAEELLRAGARLAVSASRLRSGLLVESSLPQRR